MTSRGYRAAKTRTRCARAIRDELLIGELKTVHEQNFSVYGVKKMHVAMTRRGWRIGREQTRRLMRAAGLREVQRGKPVFTTITDPAAAVPADLVQRRFTAPAPNQLWVADITFVRTSWVPGRGSATPRLSPMPVPAPLSAGRSHRRCGLKICHCKHSIMLCGKRTRIYPSWWIIPTADPNTYRWRIPTGSPNYGSHPPSGPGADSYDNALADAVNAAYKSELIHRGKPWRSVDDVEFATASWVAWYNEERLHEALGYRTPAEYEAALKAASQPASQPTPALATT